MWAKRIKHLEKSIEEINDLIFKLEQAHLLSTYPLEKARLEKDLAELQQRVKAYEDGLSILNEPLKDLSKLDDLNEIQFYFLNEELGSKAELVKLAEIEPSKELALNYYEGAYLSWDIIRANQYVERDIATELIEEICKPSELTRMWCFVGEAGAGKSTLAWYVAANVAKTIGYPLLHFRDNHDETLWYNLRKSIQKHQFPLIVLVDDIFHFEQPFKALTQLELKQDLIIISTSRNNEIPLHHRLSFFPEKHLKELGSPTNKEKNQVYQKLKEVGLNLDTKTQKLVRQAPDWLIMMLEATRGEKLGKIVAQSLDDLKKQNQNFYKAYKYICFVGHYDLAIPISLLNLDGLDEELLAELVNQRLIYKDDSRRDWLRTGHPIIAAEAFKHYHSDGRTIISDLAKAVKVEERPHRIFLGRLLYRVARKQLEQKLPASKSSLSIKDLLKQNSREIEAILRGSGYSELVSPWLDLFELCKEEDWITRVKNLLLNLMPENNPAWQSHFKLIKKQGSEEQINIALHNAKVWLETHPQDFVVRANYLELVARQKRGSDLALLIDETEQWLIHQEWHLPVLVAYLNIAKKFGTKPQLLKALELIKKWLQDQPDNQEVRKHYLKVAEKYGQAQEIKVATEETFEWLEIHHSNYVVRAAYLEFLGHCTEQQADQASINRAIEATIGWLEANQWDAHVRTAYLGLVRKRGTKSQIDTAIRSTESWLENNFQDNNVRAAYLKLKGKLI